MLQPETERSKVLLGVIVGLVIGVFLGLSLGRVLALTDRATEKSTAAERESERVSVERVQGQLEWTLYRFQVWQYNRDLRKFRESGKGEPPIQPPKPTVPDPDGIGEGREPLEE